MARYIDADLIPYSDDDDYLSQYAYRYDINEIPTADVVPKSEVAREIFERLHAHRKYDGHIVSVWLDDLVHIAKEYGIDLEPNAELKKKCTEGEI